MKGRDPLFSSRSDEWETPDELFSKLIGEFQFRLDSAATEKNCKHPYYYSMESDGLRQPWVTWTYCNPPYSRVQDFIEKAKREQTNGNYSVLLVPARTDTNWFWDAAEQATEIRLLKGRLKFKGAYSSAPFPSAIMIFGEGSTRIIKLWNYKENK